MKQILFILTIAAVLTGCSSTGDKVSVAEANLEPDDYCGFELLHELDGHRGKLWTIDSNNDGTVADGGLDGLIRIWNLASDVPELRYEHTLPVSVEDVRILKDGALLVLGEDGRIRLISDSSAPCTLAPEGVTRLNVSADESLIAASSDDRMYIYRLDDTKLLREFSLPFACFEAVFSPDNKFVFTTGHEGSCTMWSVKTGKPVKQFEGLTYDVHCIDISPDGLYIAAGSTDCRVKVWEIETGIVMATINHRDGLYDLDISNDGRLIASAGVDRRIIVAELQTGRVLTRLQHEDEIHAVAFAACDSLIAAGGYDSKLYIWGIPRIDLSKTDRLTLTNIENFEQLRAVRAHTRPCFDLAISNDDRFIATGGRDNLVHIWSTDSFMKLLTIDPQLHIIEQKFSADSARLYCRSECGVLLIYDVGNGEELHRSAADEIICGFDLSSDDKLLLTGGRHGEVSIRDADSGMVVQQRVFDDFPIINIKFSPDDSTIFFAYAGGTRDFRLVALDMLLEEKYHTEGHDGYNYHTSFSDRRGVMATAGADALIKVWNIDDGSLKMVLNKHRGKVMDTDFSADEKLLVSGSAHDHTIKLWNTGTGELLKSVTAGDEVQCVEFSNSGRFIISSGEDGILRYWGIRS